MHARAIHLVVALPAEAAPFNARFGLRRVQPDGAFPVYRNRRLNLVLSGVGAANAAAATAFLHAATGHSGDVRWINLGAAGHASLPLGTLLSIREVVDAAGGRRWRLAAPPLAGLRGETLTTLDRPDLDYARDGAFDMEASGFCETVFRFADPDRVHCLKLVSDNREHPGRGLSGKSLRRLIARRLDLLEPLLGPVPDAPPVFPPTTRS